MRKTKVGGSRKAKKGTMEKGKDKKENLKEERKKRKKEN